MYLHSYNRKRSQQNIMTSLLPRSLPRKLQWSPSLASLSRTSWGMMFSTTPSHAKQPVLAIRREDSSVWERRAPLNPHHVQNVIQNGIKVSDWELVSSSLQSQNLYSSHREHFYMQLWGFQIKSGSGLGQRLNTLEEHLFWNLIYLHSTYTQQLTLSNYGFTVHLHLSISHGASSSQERVQPCSQGAGCQYKTAVMIYHRWASLSEQQTNLIPRPIRKIGEKCSSFSNGPGYKASSTLTY